MWDSQPLLLRLVQTFLLQCPALASNLHDVLNSSQSFPAKFQDPDFQAGSQLQVRFGVTCVTSLCKKKRFWWFWYDFHHHSIKFLLFALKSDEDSFGL